MSVPGRAALGAPFGDALAAAEPAAALQLQQLAAPGADAATKAAALQAQTEQDAPASSDTNATQELGNDFSSVAPVGTPGVPCACGECIKKAIDPASPSF